MKKINSLNYVFWSVGFFMILFLANKLVIFLQDKRAQTYQIQPYMSIELLIYFFIGIYVSLLFIRKWKQNINIGLLLFVFLPNILLLTIENLRYIFQLNINIIVLVSGLTFLPSIFGNSDYITKKNSEH